MPPLAPPPASAASPASWSHFNGFGCYFNGFRVHIWNIYIYLICRGYIRIMEKKTETTIQGFGFGF